MDTPLQITFRDIDPSPAIEAQIRERVAKLEEFYPRIVSCHVTVQLAHRRHQKGNIYEVSIELGVPGKDIFVSREPGMDRSHEDVYVSLRDTFEEAKRQLLEHSQRQSGEVKRREAPLQGKITKVFYERGYGFLESPEGYEVYFHRNSVLGSKFESLQIGEAVRYAEEDGDKGPQASSLSLVGRHGHTS